MASFLLLAPSAHAIEAVVFLSGMSPEINWSRGYGGMVGFGFLKLAAFEAELAHQPGAALDSGMTNVTGTALFAPSFGPIVPFIGVGVGAQRQTLGSRSDFGTHSAFVVGAKLKLGGLLVLRAEWRKLGLAGTPPLPVDDRISGGIGLSF
jgi:hypothetical protein